jgi:hypothetical protein
VARFLVVLRAALLRAVFRFFGAAFAAVFRLRVAMFFYFLNAI